MRPNREDKAEEPQQLSEQCSTKIVELLDQKIEAVEKDMDNRIFQRVPRRSCELQEVFSIQKTSSTCFKVY